MSEYKKGFFVNDFKKEEEEEKRQKRLKKKHKIEDENIKIVEKFNIFKYIIKLVKTICAIIIYVLAAVGMIALIYEEPRNIIIEIIRNAF